MTWEEFIKACDRAVLAKIGIDRRDLPDTLCLDDYWDESMSREDAERAAREFADDLVSEQLEEMGF